MDVELCLCCCQFNSTAADDDDHYDEDGDGGRVLILQEKHSLGFWHPWMIGYSSD